MSRSIGDLWCSDLGVICTPDVFDVPRTDRDVCVVAGSDGLFEFMTNDEVGAAIFSRRRELRTACVALVDEAVRRWVKHTKASYVDDITVALAFFDESAAL